MKKLAFLLTCALLLISTGMFALTVDSTAISTTTTYSLTFLFGAFGSYLSAHIWAVVFTVAFILSEILASVKWTPKNSICQVIWYAFEAIVKFFASKKTSA